MDIATKTFCLSDCSSRWVLDATLHKEQHRSLPEGPPFSTRSVRTVPSYPVIESKPNCRFHDWSLNETLHSRGAPPLPPLAPMFKVLKVNDSKSGRTYHRCQCVQVHRIGKSSERRSKESSGGNDRSRQDCRFDHHLTNSTRTFEYSYWGRSKPKVFWLPETIECSCIHRFWFFSSQSIENQR